MRIIEQIKWGRPRKFVWDDELEQFCGEIISNNSEGEFVFKPDWVCFDARQLIRISRLVEEVNKERKIK